MTFYSRHNFCQVIFVHLLFVVSATSGFGAYQFGGDNNDAPSNLIYLRARMYDPETGTFLQKDPLGISAGVNSYRYVSNNPVSQKDPSGLYAGLDDLAFTGVGAVIGVAGQGVADLIHGHLSSWQDYVGSGLGGAAGGFAFEYSGPIGSGLTAGAVGSAAKSDLNYFTGVQPPETLSRLATDTAIGGATGFLGSAAGAVIRSGGVTGLRVVASDVVAPTVEGSAPLHVVYSAGGQAADAVGPLGAMETRQLSNNVFNAYAGSSYLDITLPVANPEAAVQAGLPALTCVTAAASAFVRGNSDQLGTLFGNGLDQTIQSFTSPSIDVGGVLIDKAATLVGSNLSDIKGVTYDPTAKQLVFIGSQNMNASTAINMDYFYTAVQAVYGSAVPPSVSLDPAAEMASPWTDWGNGDGIWQNGEINGFTLHYKPIWLQQDTSVEVEVQASSGATNYDIKVHLDAVSLDGSSGIKITAPGGYLMRLVYDAGLSSLPPGIFFDGTPFQNGSLVGGITTTATGEDAYWGMVFNNQTGQSLTIRSVTVHPDRQHRRYGGRVDTTKLGWVMAEADRVMKCLGVGKDNLNGATYSSTTVSIPGFKNLLERAQAGGSAGGYTRLWFVPNDMTLQRYIDPASGQASVVFQSSTVSLLTQSYLLGQPEDPLSKAFADHFNANYDQFAALSFPVHDPTDATGVAVINVRIFELLRQAMQAVTLARFFRDNNIPLDKWWLNSYQPPVAYSPKTVPTAYNSIGQGAAAYTVFGGVEIYKPNAYVPSSTAKDVGLAVTSAPHTDPSNPGQDLQLQSWPATTTQGPMTAVAASFTTDNQSGNVNLADTDLSFASPGELPLVFTRYYQSSYLGASALGPGWRPTRYSLQFSNPSWYDETHIMTDASNNPIAVDSNADTRLRSGTIRLVDLATGQLLDFQSSLGLSYSTNSLNQPQVTITGLSTGNVPTFSPGQNQTGAVIVQIADATKSYKVTFVDGSYLIFDNNGNLTQVADRHSYIKWYAYDTSGRLSTITDNAPSPQVITLVYNTSAPYLLQTVYGPNSSNTAANTDSTTYNYDSNTPPRLKSVTHNRSGALIAQYTYDTSNQLVDVTRKDGTKPITTTADLKGRSLVRTNARGDSSNWTFAPKDANGMRMTTATDSGSGLSWQQQFDSNGRTAYVQDPNGQKTFYGYSGSSMLPNSVQLPTPSDLQIAAQQPAISIARNLYGLTTSINNPGILGSQAMTAHYTGANLPDHVTDTAGRAVDAFYTTSNNLHIIRQYHNSQNIDTTLGYTNEFVTSVSDAMTHTWTYGKDTLGRLTSASDPTGVTIKYDYDTFGRLWHQYDPRVDVNLVSPAVTYAYDNLDRVTDVTTPTGTTHYDYDPVTQWTKTTTLTTSDGQVTKVQYGYNNQTGDTTSTTTTYQVPPVLGGGTQSVTANYGYDTFGNLKTVTPPGAQPINYNYNTIGQLQGITETSSGLTTGPSIVASNASSGIWTNQSSQTFTWGAPTSSLPVTGYNYAEDSSSSMTVNTTGQTQAWNSVSDGQHTFHVRAVDSGGNWSPESVFNLWVDTSAPAVNIISITPTPIPQGNVTVTITASVTDAGSGLVGSPAVRWCVSSDSSRPWSSYNNMNAGSGNQWSGSFVEPGTGQTLYYQIQTQDAAGNIGVFNGSMTINGPSGNDGPLMPPFALALLALLFFGIGNWLVNRKVVEQELSDK